MKQFTILLLTIFFLTTATSQTYFKKNDFYFELGGNGLFASANYERQILKTPGLGLRAGFGWYAENGFYLTLPVGINYLLPLKNTKSFVELGLGGTWTFIDGNLFDKSNRATNNNFFNIIPSVGYRVHTNKNLMWRVNVTPVINKNAFVPWLGFSVGKIF